MIDTAAKIDNFIQWLSDTGRSVKYSPDVCVACIEKVSEYAVRKNISKVPFWEISSWKVLNQIRNKLAENRIFKFSDKKNYLLFDKVGKYYSDFLAEQPSVQIDVVEQIDNKEAEVFESKNIETEHIAIPLQDTDNIVDFANDLANYAFTKPVSIELFGHSSAMRYWAETYVFVINRLYEREQSITQQYFEEQISNADIRPLFALQKETLVSPKELLCGYFVETNFSATNTVKLIKQICDYCGVSANTEIKIIYVRKNSPSTEASKDLENVVRNESNSILDDFSNWLLVEVQLGVATCRSYSSAISVVSRWAVENNIIDGDLFVVDESHTTILRVAYIMSSDSFKKYNAKQHNRFSAALTHYIRFFNSISPNPVPMKATEIETEKYIKVCTNHYHYGFSYESPIEIMRFKGFFETDNSVVCELTDDKIILVLKELGIEFEKKIFFVDLQILTCIEALIESEILKGSSIVYFDCLYEVNESWLFDGGIFSSDMLKSIIKSLRGDLICRQSYLVLAQEKKTEIALLKSEILFVWGDNFLQSFDELSQKLMYIPIDKIKYAMAQDEYFVWNSQETYTHIGVFRITDEEILELQSFAKNECLIDGTVLMSELPLDYVKANNSELSDTALYNGLYIIVFKDMFHKNRRALSLKENGNTAYNEMVAFCKSEDICTLQEILDLWAEKTGTYGHTKPLAIVNEIMVRVDENTFVSDSKVSFDIYAIDKALSLIIRGDFIGLKEISTFVSFPYCGYSWNLYLLESYCRRFSKLYRYDALVANSKNAGAIIKKSCKLSYAEIMISAVAMSNVSLEKAAVINYLNDAGYLGKHSYSGIDNLLEKAANMRMRRQ